MDRGITGVDFTADGVRYHREALSSAVDHAIVSHLTADRPRFDLLAIKASNEQTGIRIKNYADGRRDPFLAVLYYKVGRYLLISSSRPDNPLPSNSQGIWGDGLDLPWKSDYKSNINYQMNYWPSETANLSELHLPAIRFDANMVKPGTKTEQAYYNAPGWVVAYEMVALSPER